MTTATRADTVAAEEALGLATARLEAASAGVARWLLRPGAHRTRALSMWEKAWREYRLALVVCNTICPRRLNPGQRLLARLGMPEGPAA